MSRNYLKVASFVHVCNTTNMNKKYDINNWIVLQVRTWLGLNLEKKFDMKDATRKKIRDKNEAKIKEIDKDYIN
ncbi:hypothetical protein CWI39_0041p0020 [Hamiltosporidium magnivora]|uniref:Uncharacterized protein n=1 Tax=Hamiltosporidium magnivora TaxID=148818 RepID=A0A4Q9LQC5_9MICR|nr:hypothetical protein CWI39_0041p0020 [Hamiltosporidium magnivora]